MKKLKTVFNVLVTLLVTSFLFTSCELEEEENNLLESSIAEDVDVDLDTLSGDDFSIETSVISGEWFLNSVDNYGSDVTPKDLEGYTIDDFSCSFNFSHLSFNSYTNVGEYDAEQNVPPRSNGFGYFTRTNNECGGSEATTIETEYSFYKGRDVNTFEGENNYDDHNIIIKTNELRLEFEVVDIYYNDLGDYTDLVLKYTKDDGDAYLLFYTR